MNTSSEKKVLFLYSELAGYTVACFNHASRRGINIHVVHWPVNKEAPFNFKMDPEISRYDRNDLSTTDMDQLVQTLAPNALLISGWMDKDYLKIAAKYSGQLPVILLLDNPWQGTLKQYLAGIWGRIKLRTIFSDCWVPGERQRKYAQHLGFSDDHIETGFYCADLHHFNALYKRTKAIRERKFPKRFLFVGRYVDFKGISELWTAFDTFHKEHPDWELWCVGTGEMFDQRDMTDGIKHFGFLQPSELEQVIPECGIFIIPSRKEPWGVVVHEFAAAGFPLICSTEVGAAEKFLQEGSNGFFHEPQSAEQIKRAMENCAAKPDDELVEMAGKSHQLAQEINPDQWTQTLEKYLSRKCTFDRSGKSTKL